MKIFHINNLFLEQPKKFGDISIYQIGVLQSTDKTVFDTHSHGNFFEFTAIIEGTAEISANGTPLSLSENDIFLSYPFDSHKIISFSDELKYYFMAFDTTNEQFLFNLDKITQQYSAIENRKFKNTNIFSYLAQAVCESTEKDIFSDEYCTALFLGIIIELLRQFNSQKNSLRLPNKHEVFAYSVMNYINTHVYSMKSLTELSKIFGYEYSHISKIFSKTTKQSLAHYYHIQRLDVARSLLSKGTSVNEVAKILNYSSVYSFSNTFKKQYGLSPLNYKKTFPNPLFPSPKMQTSPKNNR